MLRSNLQQKLLVAWSERIVSSDAKEALWQIVGFAGCSRRWKCHPQWKGYLPDFRFHRAASNEQFFSFVPAQKWLLFYFRKPAISSGRYSWHKIVSRFTDAEQKAGEWRVRVHNVQEARTLIAIIESGVIDG